MIVSFGSHDSEELYERGFHPRWHPTVCRAAMRKLVMLDSAESLFDVGSVPGNRLEKLNGISPQKYSIRVNNQWRIVFAWSSEGPEEVEICDYH